MTCIPPFYQQLLLLFEGVLVFGGPLCVLNGYSGKHSVRAKLVVDIGLEASSLDSQEFLMHLEHLEITFVGETDLHPQSVAA